MENFSNRSPVTYEQFYETTQLSCVVTLDGVRYPVIRANWTSNAHGATDTGTVTIPLSSNPDFTVALFRGDYTVVLDSNGNPMLVSPSTPGAKVIALYPNGTTALVPPGTKIPAGATLASNNSPVFIKIYAGFPQHATAGSTDIDQLICQFWGIVDLYSGIFDEDTVTFSCRSVGSQLVDARLVNVSMSQTMQSFLSQQATRFSLPTPIVTYAKGSTPATIQEVLAYDYIGGSNFAAALYGMRVWDLAIRASLVDDADIWVDIATGTIHYEQPSAIARNKIGLKYGRDWIGLGASHAPNFSKTVQVQVHAHQPRSKTSTTIRVENDADGNLTVKQSSKFTTSDAILGTNQTIGTTSSTSPTGTTTTSTTLTSSSGGNFNASIGQGAAESAKQKYPLFVGNVSPQRALAMAVAYWRQISQHEFAIKGKIPITNALLANLSITSLLKITGTPWSLVNDTYFPRALNHTISVEDGWTCDIEALNHRLGSGAV